MARNEMIPTDKHWSTPEKVEWVREYSEPEPNTGCWLWLRSIRGNGYAQMTYPGGGKQTYVTRWLLGILDSPGVEACHKCDTPTCVNPHHLFAGTGQDNQQDCIRKGRKPRGETHKNTKLTEKQVSEIFVRAHLGEYQTDLAQEFGISRSLVGWIKNGLGWDHLSLGENVNCSEARCHGSSPGVRNPNSKLTEDQALDIYLRANNGEMQKDLASEFGVTQTNISSIKLKKAWGHIHLARAMYREDK